MKRIFSLLIAFTLIVSMSTSAFAAETAAEEGNTVFSYYNTDGEIVTIVISRANNSATSKIYVNGILTQRATANAITKTIKTEIFDLETMPRGSIQEKNGTMNDFATSVVHLPISSERIDIIKPNSQTRSIYDEPIDNAGLSPSGYGDGYYYLGSYGGYYYAPEVFGYLYRTYTSTYDGETKYWSWSEGDTLGAISVYIALFGGPVSAIISLLLFTAGEVLLYNQSIELATYTFDYTYRVRVYGSIHFTTQRNITYWRIDNVTEGTTRWEEKRFNDGFPMANTEMVKAGIDNYLLSIQ